MRDPRVNRGSAFTAAERAALGLEGLLPAGVLSLDDQADRSYDQYLVYDPVVAVAIELYRHEFQRPDGVYLSIDDSQGVDAALRNYGLGSDDVDLLVATDAEEILGIGDWGANGMAILIGKLAVYTAAAGIHPDRVIPVMLDVGTDRESLLNDPLYVGNGHRRVRGERYDQLVAAYVKSASRLFPNALLHRCVRRCGRRRACRHSLPAVDHRHRHKRVLHLTSGSASCERPFDLSER